MLKRSTIAALLHNSEFPVFSQATLFKGLDARGVRECLGGYPTQNLRAGDSLFLPQQKVTTIYIVLSGQIHFYNSETRIRPLSVVGPGGCIGVISVLRKEPMAYTLVAAEPTVVLGITETDLMSLVNSVPEIARNYSYLLSEYIRSNDHFDSQAQFDARRYQRVKLVDDLTGLHNRVWIEDVLDRQLKRNAYNQSRLSVLLIQVDRLGQFINDFGESATEQAIYQIGRTLAQRLRPTDLIARYAWHQFLAVLPETLVEGAEAAARRLCDVVGAAEIELPGECNFPPLSISVGISEAAAQDKSPELVIQRAEMALVRAQAIGCNTVAV